MWGLINKFRSVNRERYGLTPLTKAIIQGDLDTVKSCVNAGANVNKKNKNGKPPLLFAINSWNINIIKFLLECGANPNFRDKKRCLLTPLSSAIIYAKHHTSIDVVLLLMDHADINLKGFKGRTPLVTAIIAKNSVIVKELLRRGAKTYIVYDGKSLIDLAEYHSAYTIADMLRYKNNHSSFSPR